MLIGAIESNLFENDQQDFKPGIEHVAQVEERSSTSASWKKFLYCDCSESVKIAKEATLNLSQAKPALTQLNLKSLAMETGLKFSGCPTQADSHFQSSPSIAEQPVCRPSITQSFLEKFPLYSVRSSLQAQGADGFDLDLFIPLFNQATAQEKPGFFGYHATTARHWVFNEMIKQILKIESDDFYFLRAPSASYKMFPNVSVFLKKFLEKEHSIEEMRRFIHLFFLRPIQETQLEFNDEKATQIFKALLLYADVYAIQDDSAEALAKQLTDFVGKKTEALDKWLKTPFREEYEEEETAEEHNFLIKIIWPVNDVWDEQQMFLLSLNIALFGNYSLSSESTVHVFAKGESVDFSPLQLEQAAEEFLESHGIAKEKAKELFTYAESLIDLKQGVLLQFFDDPAYSHLDKVAYLCSNFGKPLSAYRLSDFLMRFDPMKEAVEGGQYILHPQIRLLMTAEDTLNPFSWLKIKQYDLIVPDVKEAIKNQIRAQLK